MQHQNRYSRHGLYIGGIEAAVANIVEDSFHDEVETQAEQGICYKEQ